MKKWLGMPLVQIALCAAVYALVWHYLGKTAFVVASPLFAAAVARPLIVLASSVRHTVRERLWMPVHGQHYVFKDTTIHVLEDDDHRRWVNLADVRKVVGATASERALAITYADRLKVMGTPAQVHIRDDALVAHLGKENRPTALRFRTWVERNIAFPGRRIQKRFGVHPDTPGSDDSP